MKNKLNTQADKLKNLQESHHSLDFQSKVDKALESGSLASNWWWNSQNSNYLRHTFPFYACKEFWKSLPQSKILNLMDGKGGCEGHFFNSLGHKSCSADISIEALKAAKDIGFIDEYSKQDAEELSFENESFDYVVVKESLHHLPRPYMAIYEMLRVCKEGIYIVEPQDNSYSIGDEPYESCGNFKFAFSIKELIKSFIALGYTNICYRNLFEIEFIINENGGYVGGEEFKKTEPHIRNLIKQFHDRHSTNIGQFVCVFCFKNKPPQEHINKLKSAGWTFPLIKGNPHLQKI